jgi:hypothetical protein
MAYFLSGAKRYSRLLVTAVVPPLLHNGVGFEVHPQNMLLRLSRSTLTPTGFILRDLGDLLVHPATLSASTGFEFSFLPSDAVVSKPEDAAKLLYHTLIQNHLQRLARVLRLHSDGSAWSAVRAHLTQEIPHGSWLWWAWMDDTVKSLSGKCLMKMKIEGVCREVTQVSCFLLRGSYYALSCSFSLIRVLNPSAVHLRTLSKLDTLSTRRDEWNVKNKDYSLCEKM